MILLEKILDYLYIYFSNYFHFCSHCIMMDSRLQYHSVCSAKYNLKKSFIIILLISTQFLCCHCFVVKKQATYNTTREMQYQTPFADSPLLPSLLLSLACEKHAPDTKKCFREEYDFIIVGAGSAGATLAARLSEVACVNVLLLEAGPTPPLLTEVPASYGSFYGSDIDWYFETVPQKYAASGHKQRKLKFMSGKGLGGSTIFNALLASRGNRLDYDHWEELGAKGWSYTDVLPYFKKLEDNKAFNNREYHGTGGPITIEPLSFHLPLSVSVQKAAEELGYSFVDANGENQNGFSIVQNTVRNAQRCSTSKGYLVPVEGRPNLDIVSKAFVKKVLITGRRATGVLVDFEGQEHKIRATREVIVSAGTFKSAQLLMLTGIGPKEHLNQMNIKVIADLPVGENLQNHISTWIGYETNDEFVTYVKRFSEPEYIREYIHKRKGPLSLSQSLAGATFLQRDGREVRGANPDVLLKFQEIDIEHIGKTSDLRDEVYDAVFHPYVNKTVYACSSQVLRPKSRGTVRLNSSDPYDPPLINPKYFKDPDDVQILLEGLKICMKIANTTAMLDIGSKRFEKLPPECQQYTFDEDEGLKCYIRSIIVTNPFHPVGTVRMGCERDASTVVDPKLRVKGFKGLRVVDASIMPQITSGNTNIPTIMIAEKASDIIKADINCGNDL